MRDKLTALKVASLKKPGRYADGGGLYLHIPRPGARYWQFRFMIDGRAREMGLGPVADISLAEARELATRARAMVRDKRDPLEAKRKAQDEARNATGERQLFRDAAEEFISLHTSTWRNERHQKQWPATLKAYAYPTLGNRPIGEIDGALITEALVGIWQDKAETARRTKQRIERVIQWVKDGKPLPNLDAAKPQRHLAALPYKDLPELVSELRDNDSLSARCLEFTILTAARTSEALGATWDEIDLDAALWVVPASRMKGNRTHKVPLPDRVIAILRDLPRTGDRIFPSLSSKAMLQLLGRLRPGVTVHGFRSTFMDWSHETTAFAKVAIDMALAHAVSDKVEAAYRRGDLFDKRRRLMSEWAAYCEAPAITGATVHNIRQSA
jgi:integrase